MKIKFLLDENLNPRIKRALLHLEPAIDIIRVGESDAPALGTSDADILLYLEQSQRLLVTDNRRTMPIHIAAHHAAHKHHWGVMLTIAQLPISRIAEAM